MTSQLVDHRSESFLQFHPLLLRQYSPAYRLEGGEHRLLGGEVSLEPPHAL